ncbi:PHD finger protein [Klebsiella phage vB_KpnS_MK54]|uniref:PHD finger protein n=1 Tax=Klebsiella phage vB_KpnS_MK54 TaxID=2783667 RepID=UPI001CE65D57|nr:PHD finger protein [Klebsiella phage vB_KpnS_MK54]QZD26118.1 PHD finger protein [Klebsiella phage vB_KpnS_MK54]
MKPEMKLTDILVEWLPSRGGWPEGAECCHLTQYDRHCLTIGFYHSNASAENNSIISKTEMVFSGIGCLGNTLHDCTVTAEQYEAELAAKSDSWIEWGGGKCPVEKGTLIDVKWRDGKVDTGIPAKIRCPSRERQAIIWHHAGHELDIIAYRLHKPQESEQAEADDEADLNECIGQDVVPFWNGEGQTPPVGYMCERSWSGDEWQPCKILFTSNQIVVVKLKGSGMEDAYNIGDVTFRPIRSEADRKREKAIAKITDAICGEIPDTGMATAAKYAARAYDAIAAGKITGVNLED